VATEGAPVGHLDRGQQPVFFTSTFDEDGKAAVEARLITRSGESFLPANRNA
jgi:hypothetical protein